MAVQLFQISLLQIWTGFSVSNVICVVMYVYPECSFFLPVNFQAAPVNRNDTELTCSCFIKVRNTTLIRRSRIKDFNELHSKCRRE